MLRIQFFKKTSHFKTLKYKYFLNSLLLLFFGGSSYLNFSTFAFYPFGGECARSGTFQLFIFTAFLYEQLIILLNRYMDHIKVVYSILY